MVSLVSSNLQHEVSYGRIESGSLSRSSYVDNPNQMAEGVGFLAPPQRSSAAQAGLLTAGRSTTTAFSSQGSAFVSFESYPNTKNLNAPQAPYRGGDILKGNPA